MFEGIFSLETGKVATALGVSAGVATVIEIIGNPKKGIDEIADAVRGGIRGGARVGDDLPVGGFMDSNINCVYNCVVDGTTRYVGITNDIARRGKEHLASKDIVIRGLSNLSREDARAVEQTLINFHGLDKIDGGTLINRINSISAVKNPTLYEQSLIRGNEILRSVDYPEFN